MPRMSKSERSKLLDESVRQISERYPHLISDLIVGSALRILIAMESAGYRIRDDRMHRRIGLDPVVVAKTLLTAGELGLITQRWSMSWHADFMAHLDDCQDPSFEREEITIETVDGQPVEGSVEIMMRHHPERPQAPEKRPMYTNDAEVGTW